MENTIVLRQERADKTRLAQETHERFVNLAKAENRDLSGEEKAEVDAILSDVEALDVRVNSLEVEEQKETEDKANRSRRLEDASRRSKELQTRRVAPIGNNLGASNPLASNEYRDAFREYLSTGEMRATPSSISATFSTTLANGGYGNVPVQLADQFVMDLQADSVIRRLATVKQIDNAMAYRIPKMTTQLSNPAWTGIGTCLDPDTVTEDILDLTPKYLAKLATVGLDQAMIGGKQLEELIMSQFVRKFAEAEEYFYAVGTGASSQPLGVFVANAGGIDTSRDINAGTTGTIGHDDLVNLVYGIKDVYRRSSKCAFVMSRPIAAMVRKLKDTTGQPLWQPSLAFGQPDTLLGYPIYTDEFAPTAVTAGSYQIVFGDFSNYWVVQRNDMQVTVLRERYIDCGLVGYLSGRFVTGWPVLAQAFTRLKAV